MGVGTRELKKCRIIQSLRSTKQLEVSLEALEGVIGGDDFLISLMRWFLRLGWLTTISSFLAVTPSSLTSRLGVISSFLGSCSSSSRIFASGSPGFTHFGPSGSNTETKQIIQGLHRIVLFHGLLLKNSFYKKSTNRVCVTKLVIFQVHCPLYSRLTFIERNNGVDNFSDSHGILLLFRLFSPPD